MTSEDACPTGMCHYDKRGRMSHHMVAHASRLRTNSMVGHPGRLNAVQL
jgi:hypothetical protein